MLLRTVVLIVVSIVFACCNSKSAPASQTPANEPVVAEVATEPDIDFVTAKFDKECNAGIIEDIGFHKLWVYDSIFETYKTDSTFIHSIYTGKYTCLYNNKDSTYIRSIFGKQFKIQTLLPFDADSITYSMSYFYRPSINSTITKTLKFYFKKGKFVTKIVALK